MPYPPQGGGPQAVGPTIEADEVIFSPAGDIEAVEVQSAIEEVDSEKLAVANNLSDVASAATSRSNLGLVIGTDVLAPNGSGAALSGIPLDADFTSNGIMKRTGAGTYSVATLGTDYYGPGGTDVAIADGGTGAGTAAAAFTALKQAATTTATGVVELSTDAESVAGTLDTVVVTPGTLTARLAEPGAIGGTTPGSILLTSLGVATTDPAGVAHVVLSAGSPAIFGGDTIATLTGVTISNADPSVLTKDATIDDDLSVGDIAIVNSGTNAVVGVYVVKAITVNTNVTLDRQAATGACTDASVTYVNGEGLTVASTGALHLSDGVGASIIRQYNEPGLGSRLTFGLSEVSRTLIICDAGDVDTDFGLSVAAAPRLYILNAGGTEEAYLSQAELVNSSGNFTLQAPGQLIFNGGAGAVFDLYFDLTSGNAFTFQSGTGDELTDTDGEQSFVYIEPKYNAANSEPFNALQIKQTETQIGTGGSNFIKAGTTADDDLFKVSNSGAIKAGTGHTAIHTTVLTLTAAQVNALRTSPQTIVAAQGTNTWIELVSAVLTYDYGSAPFAVDANEDLVIEWADGTAATASIETTGFLDQTDDEIRYYPSVLAAGADPEASINQALRIRNTGTGETANGTGCELDVRVTYRVHNTGF